MLTKIKTIDSHTGGEPTRVIIEGGPYLGDLELAACQKNFQARYDHIRSAVVNEPRGSDVMVGALLLKAKDPRCIAGVIFFNNVGYLGMCGHGTIGLIKTLAHMDLIEPGQHWIETPVGCVQAHLHPTGEVTVFNVPSYLYLKDIELFGPAQTKITDSRNIVFCPGNAYDRSPCGCGTGTSAKMACLYEKGLLPLGPDMVPGEHPRQHIPGQP